MKKIIGIVLIIASISFGIYSYQENKDFKNLSDTFITIIGLIQAIDFIFEKEDKEIKDIDENTKMILDILENKKEE